MEVSRGRVGARTWSGREKVLLIALAMFLEVSSAQPVIFSYSGSSSDQSQLQLQVPNNPGAVVTPVLNNSITCLGDFFQQDGNLVLSLPQPLGQERTDVKGKCLYRNPIQQLNSNSFSTMFTVQMLSTFAAAPCAGGDLSATLQGLAFIIASDISTQGAGGGYLGWLNSTTNAKSGQVSSSDNVAIEIDLIQDLQFQDPVGLHVGLDNNSLTSMFTATLDSSLVRYRTNIDYGQGTSTSGVGGTLTVWIEYVGQVLKVFVSDGNVQKPTTPILDEVVDFSGLLSQGGMFVGFSGSISSVTSTNPSLQNQAYGLGYTIYQWTFNSDGLAPDYPRDSDGTMQFVSAVDHYLSERKRQIERTIIISAAIPSALLLMILVFIIWKLYRRNARLTALARKYEIEEGMLDRGSQNFKYKTLSTATKGFSSNELLGSGGFGSVYRGKLLLRGDEKPTEIAVKRISAASRQGAREFLAEVKVIGQVQHRNLVRLLGWCHERGELLLVYDYMPNGSVDQHLFKDSEGEHVLTWARRLKIVSGVAAALAYLHEEWEHRVIHRDVKSSNVMLDRDFNARLGDFGLAKLSEHDEAPQSTTVLAGTYGYLAPELAHTLRATEKTDVYSFGAMVLEVATGKRPILSFEDQKLYNYVLLVDWVWSLFRDNALLDAADCKIQNAYDPGEMIMFLKIGLLCSHPDPDERPTMREVIHIWKGSSPFPLLPQSKPIPIFVTSRDSVSLDTTVTISTDVSRNADTETDRAFMLDLEVQNTSTILEWTDVGHSFASKTPLPHKVISRSSSLRHRQCNATTTLPL